MHTMHTQCTYIMAKNNQEILNGFWLFNFKKLIFQLEWFYKTKNNCGACPCESLQKHKLFYTTAPEVYYLGALPDTSTLYFYLLLLYISTNCAGVNISGFSISTSKKSLSPVTKISTSSIIAVYNTG